MSDDDTIDLGIPDLTDAVEVGAGGFGTVYRARQASLRRDVAVKMVANTVKDAKVRIRFEREIQAMGMLSGHPNIVTVYDSGFTSSGQPYILMDYMAQGSLGDRLDRDGSLPWTDVLDIMVKVCGALETAHQAGVLHRDLKPENVLVSAYGEPKLGDFGIARLKGGPETGTSSLTASIEHVAPELLEARPPSVASDLYALGSTMFKLLTGEAAFVRAADESIVPALTRIRDEPVPDLRLRGIPDPVAGVLERAMAKDPAARFASAVEMGGAIRTAQRGLNLLPTAMPVREEDAAAARESTRTIRSDDIAQSMEDLGLTGPDGSVRAPAPPPPRPSGPVPFPGGAAPQPQPGRQGPPPVLQPQGFTGGYGGPSAPGAPGGPGAPPSGSSTPWGKVAAGVGAVAVVTIVGVGIALSGGSEDPPSPSPSTPESVTPAADPTYAAFERLTDDTGGITVDVPRQWDDVDGGPWIVDGAEVGRQIEASSDLQDFRSSWGTPGVIFGASETLRASFDPAGLLDAVSFASQCTYDGREPYSDAAYTGFRDEYSRCGNTDATYTIIAAEPPTQDLVLLVQFQSVAPRDDAALAQALNTFFVLPDDEAAAATEQQTGQ